MGFGHIERAIGCSCDVLVIENDLECNDDVHLSTFLYRYFNSASVQKYRPNWISHILFLSEFRPLTGAKTQKCGCVVQV